MRLAYEVARMNEHVRAAVVGLYEAELTSAEPRDQQPARHRSLSRPKIGEVVGDGIAVAYRTVSALCTDERFLVGETLTEPQTVRVQRRGAERALFLFVVCHDAHAFSAGLPSREASVSTAFPEGPARCLSVCAFVIPGCTGATMA